MAAHHPIRRPGKIKDITGKRFGRLVVEGIAPERSRTGKVLWRCRCDCGIVKEILGCNIKRGLSRSCGCGVIEAAHRPNPKNRKHGFAGTWVYRVWSKMIDRCYNPSAKHYKDYGGRGIRVCDRWKLSIAAFYEDMGDRPTPQHKLERVANNGDYCPDNCRWATPKEQANNRRSSRVIEYNGEKLTLTAWADRFGINAQTLSRRLEMGWPLDEAFTEPPGKPWGHSRRNRTKS